MCQVIDVMAQITVKVIDVLAFLGYRCPGSSHITSKTNYVCWCRHAAYNIRKDLPQLNTLCCPIKIKRFNKDPEGCHRIRWIGTPSRRVKPLGN